MWIFHVVPSRSCSRECLKESLNGQTAPRTLSLVFLSMRPLWFSSSSLPTLIPPCFFIICVWYSIIYMESERMDGQTFGAHDYQGWQVPRSLGWVGNLRSRRANGVVPVWRPAGSRPRKSQYFSSSLKAGKNSVLARRQFPLTKPFCSSQACNWLDEVHPH